MAREYAFFALRSCDAPTSFRLFPDTAELLADAGIVDGKAGVMVALDLGQVAPEHRGVVIPIVQLPVCFASVDFQRQSDGRFAYVKHEGRGASDGLTGLTDAIASQVKTCVRDKEATVRSRFGIALRGFAEPVASKEYENKEGGVGWCFGSDVFWAQARTREGYGVPAPAWIYAGLVECAFVPGYHFSFYEPKSGRLRQVVEMT